MKRSLKFMATTLLVSLMVLMLFGCSKGSGEFEGKLLNANNETLVVKSEGDVEVFNTNSKTEYDLGDEEEITAGDTILVKYHSQGKQKIAETVVVVDAVDHSLKMTGELTDLNTTDLTVSSDSLTATFSYDEETEIVGEKLNEGDEVKVTYKGDLSEKPHAIKIEVLQEQEDDPHYEAHGIISDVSETSVLLSIDSAEAHRFIRNPQTEVVSEDDKIQIGDRAEITFTGDINQDPVATRIIVHHQAKKDKNVINGTIHDAEKTYLELDTGKNRYKILVDSKTQFTGNKYQSGVKATVTYTGELNKDPLATEVYCDKAKKKDDPTETKSKATETKTKATETKTKATETKTKPTETKTQTETKTETKPPTPPTPVIVTVKGYIETWDEDNNKGVFKVDGDEENPLELTIADVDLPIGYFPEVGDYVQIEYDKDKLDLLDMQLIERPDPDPQTQPDRNEGGKAEPTTEATTEVTTKAKPEPEPKQEPADSGQSGGNGSDEDTGNGSNQEDDSVEEGQEDPTAEEE